MADPLSIHDDPRVTPARRDLAAKHLEHRIKADRYVEGTLRKVVAPQAPVRDEPRHDALLDTEALKGELVTVYEDDEEGWSWGQLQSDNYVGWLPTEALGDVGRGSHPSRRGDAHAGVPGPSIKIPPIEALPFGCQLSIARVEPPFAVTATNGFVPLRHLVDARSSRTRFRRRRGALPRRALSVGRENQSRPRLLRAGAALARAPAAHPCWRDSDMQEAVIPPIVEPAADLSNLKRGDLIFWEGHVAIVRDPTTLIHANAFHMAVAIEPIAEAVARNRAAGIEISSVRRLEGWLNNRGRGRPRARAASPTSKRSIWRRMFKTIARGEDCAALCGVIVTFGWVHSGLATGSGSIGNTSSVAPASVPSSSATRISASTCKSPRDALIR